MKDKIKIKPNDTIVFIGDSITDAGRFESVYKPFGYGYVHFAANHLLAKYPDYNIKIINTGISGNTIRDLKSRWQKDCIDYKPDITSILIGINDVWRFHTNRLDEAVFLEEYKLIYEELLSQLKEQTDSQIVLIEPFMFCDNTNDVMFVSLEGYIEVVNNLADKFDTVLVPLQKSINTIIQRVPGQKWSEDMVHPYIWAHCWITEQWLKETRI